MATHSSVLAWRIPGMGEPGGLPSTGSHRVGHDWSDLAAANIQKIFNKWCPYSSFWEILSFRSSSWTSLVAQCIGICLPMQEAWIRSLVWEDSTCHWTTKPVYRNYRVYALQPTSHNFWACAPQLLKPTWLEPVFCNKANHCNEKPARPTKNTPHSPQLEKVHTNAMKTQHSQKKFLNN